MLSFKKVCSLGLATALVATGLMATTAQADATTATKDSDSGQSTALFSVTDNGTLELSSTPTFNFGDVDASTLALGGKQDLNPDSSTLQVKDTRGAGDHTWNLTASLTTPFTLKDDDNTNDDSTTLPNAYLTVNAVAGSNSSADGVVQINGATINATAATVIPNEDAYAGTSIYTFDKASDATLQLPAVPNFTAGQYDGTVTWNLTAAQ
jgi:hypothetical protein